MNTSLVEVLSEHTSLPEELSLQDSANAKVHPFARCVNPHVADLLGRFWLDKRFVRGEGCELIDDRGRRYLDCVAAYGALPFGHNPPEIWQSLLQTQWTSE